MTYEVGSFTLGSTVVKFGSTLTTIAGLTLSGATLTGNTTLPGSGQISSTGLLGLGNTPGSWLDFGNTLSASSWGTSGVAMRGRAATYTDTTGSGTIADRTANSFGQPTFASSSAVTLTRASTLYIAGPPIAGSNTTITTPYALYVASGSGLIAGTLGVGTGLSTTSTTAGVEAAYSSSFNDGSTLSFLKLSAGTGGTALNTLLSQKAAGDATGRAVAVSIGAVESARFMTGGDLRQGGGSALATNATDGFLLIATCAGAPSGVPTNAGAGQIPMIWDKTNLQLYVYTGGAWKKSAAFT